MSTTAAAGFKASGVAAGIKSSGAPDMALVVNEGPNQAAAAVFTSNRVCAAPVKWSRQAISDGRLHAVVLNSGGANACTGAPGFQDTVYTATAVAEALGCEPADVGVCSTGLIGARLPMSKVLAGVAGASQRLSVDGGPDAARAIMTTDTHPKTAELTVDGYTIGGMAKGAGMLAPGLATMLVVITTDADLGADSLRDALKEATRATFDRLDSDGCMSTNDTVIVMASGASKVVPDQPSFTANLITVCQQLALQLLGDAEGSSHDIHITVENADTEVDALEVGRSIARSNLFKCAIFGNDPNWGRVLSAIGVTSAKFDPDQIDVTFNGVTVCRAGGIGDDRKLIDLKPRQVDVTVDLHAGSETATIYTNDLTYGYVKENAEYSS